MKSPAMGYVRLVLASTLAVASACSDSPAKDDIDAGTPDSGPVDPLVSTAEPATFTVGHFQIALTGGDGAPVLLDVTSTDVDGSRWQTQPGIPFVTAARAKNYIESLRGSFTFHEQILATCSNQTITSFALEGEVAVLQGQVSGPECSADYTLRFAALADRRLGFTLTLAGDVNRARLHYAADPDERFFGFGTQYDAVDLSGRRIPIWVSEQGHGRGAEPLSSALDALSPGSAGDWYTTYAPLPYYFTSAGRSVFLDSSEYLAFDLTTPGTVTLDVWSSEIRGQIFAADTAVDIIEVLTEVTGRMQPLPAWTQTGAIIRVHGGSTEVLATVQEYRDAGVPLAAVWIEDWSGERPGVGGGTRLWWNWEPDADLYPDWESLITTLRDDGIRPLIYFNPFLVDVTDKPNAVRDLYSEAEQNNYFVLDPEGEPYLIGQGGFSAAMVDLTNEAARTWLKDIIKEQIGIGVSGWMADFGEALPHDAVLSSGVSAAEYHNFYPVAWAKLNRAAVEEMNALGDVMFFSRSGYTGSAGAATMFWLGDQLVTWDDYDGIKTVIPALISSGLSGRPLNHSDIGGYFSIDAGALHYVRDKELLWRWIELAAFTPLYRTHETNNREANYQVYSEPDTLAHFARFAELFAALATYRQSLMDEAAARGTPLVRPLFLHAPDDAEASSIEDQFMLGPDLVIAPVLDPGVDSRDVYLPAGEWIHLWSGQAMGDAAAGTSVNVDAPLGAPPVFYRAGSAAGEALAATVP